jgi:hypothetical protein
MCAARAILRTAPSAGGDYLVQVSSQKNEADVQASYRAMQNKFPAALGSRPPEARRSRRQGGLLPHDGRPVRIHRRGGPVLRQFEKCRRQCVIQKMAKLFLHRRYVQCRIHCRKSHESFAAPLALSGSDCRLRLQRASPALLHPRTYTV